MKLWFCALVRWVFVQNSEDSTHIHHAITVGLEERHCRTSDRCNSEHLGCIFVPSKMLNPVHLPRLTSSLTQKVRGFQESLLRPFCFNATAIRLMPIRSYVRSTSRPTRSYGWTHPQIHSAVTCNHTLNRRSFKISCKTWSDRNAAKSSVESGNWPRQESHQIESAIARNRSCSGQCKSEADWFQLQGMKACMAVADWIRTLLHCKHPPLLTWLATAIAYIVTLASKESVLAD